MGMIRKVLGRNGDLAKRKVVVTAGGTQEPIDPVRIITNRSSGKMGYAIAEAARDRGADVVLITTPTALERVVGVETVLVETVAQMRVAVLAACKGADILVMAAAVSDFRPAQVADQKIKKGPEASDLVLRLVKNPDFFVEVPPGVLRVGFAAESHDLLANARAKLKEKSMDLIVGNDITEAGSGFGTDTNRVAIIDRTGRAEDLPLLQKYAVAQRIFDRVVPLLDKR
jgi:phosphopantothenoylcysteine decarboxylase/phosphopantothenate--cysteine ligase